MSAAAPPRWKHRFILFLLIWVLAAGIFCLRDRETFVNPQLYAEDAAWLDLLRHEGFATMAVHARKDYFVVGNLLLMETARLIHGNQVELVPLSIAIVSWLFLGFVAALPFLLFYHRLPPPALALFALAVALMPFGDVPSIIIGRIVNTGFFWYVIALWLLLYLRQKPASYAAQGGVLLSLLTNPGTFMLLPLLWPFRKIHWPLLGLACAIAAVIFHHLLLNGKIGNHLQEPLTWTLLPRYGLQLIALTLLLLAGWFFAPRLPFLAIAYGFFMQLAMWMIARPGIFAHERMGAYFMPLNLLLLAIAALICLGVWRKNRQLVIFILLAYFGSQIFVIQQRQYPLLTGLPPWQEQLAEARANPQAAQEKARQLAARTIAQKPKRIGGKKWREGNYLYLQAVPVKDFWYLMWPRMEE